jgi:hypothetical protein
MGSNGGEAKSRKQSRRRRNSTAAATGSIGLIWVLIQLILKNYVFHSSINPAPGKPQMPTEAAEREMAKRIMRNHKIVTGHQACERRARQKRQLDQKLEESNVEMGQ